MTRQTPLKDFLAGGLKGGDLIAKYRRKDSFISKDPEKRARSLANLRRGQKPGTLQKVLTKPKKLEQASIIEFATDPLFLNLSFKERPAQEVILRVIYGMPLNDDQLKIYQKITTNKKEYEAGIEKEESVLVLGARSGKSLLASIIALYEATRRKWAKYLNPGESGYIEVISTRQKQSEAIIGANCARLMENSYNLKGLVKDVTQSEMILKNDMRILSLPCNSTAGRGLPIICLILDEVAHFFTEGVKSDEVIFNALNPRRAQFPGSKMILISTPAAKQGLIWNFYEQGFKVAGRLTAQAETLFMNPLVDRKFLKKEKARDIDNYLREFEAKFAEKVESFLSYELVINSLKLAGDLPFDPEFSYCAGIDASGLAGRDKFALAISHNQDNDIYVDLVKSWDLKDPDPIMRDIEGIAGLYNIAKISIDKYAKGWVMAALEKIGLEVVIRPSLAEIFVNLKSLMIGDRLFLPDNPGIKKGLLNTQAYYGRNNALSIGHTRDSEGHADDVDATATAVFEASQGVDEPFFYSGNDPDERGEEDPSENEKWNPVEDWSNLSEY